MARSRSRTATGETGNGETGVLIEHCLPVQEAVWRIVSDAARGEALLSLEDEARRIAEMFPSAELTPAQIADALVFAAVDAGAPLQVRAQPKRQVPTIVLPAAYFLLGGRRKRRGKAGPPPTFAADPLPATT
jgi:hypothetical protein